MKDKKKEPTAIFVAMLESNSLISSHFGVFDGKCKSISVNMFWLYYDQNIKVLQPVYVEDFTGMSN